MPVCMYVCTVCVLRTTRVSACIHVRQKESTVFDQSWLRAKQNWLNKNDISNSFLHIQEECFRKIFALLINK